MDAYLAAFALGGGLRLVTFDRGFKAYARQGLRLLILSPTAQPGG
jgi:predicted nucleic acid-binding protein